MLAVYDGLAETGVLLLGWLSRKTGHKLHKLPLKRLDTI